MRNHTRSRLARAVHSDPYVTGQTMSSVERVRPPVQTTDLLAGWAPTLVPANVDDVGAMSDAPVLGAYEVIGLLKSGGMGGIYAARHVKTGERVALKVLNPRLCTQRDLVERLFFELEVSRKVGHQCLVDIRERGVSLEGTPFLVMELIDGENLGDLAERGRIEIGAVAAIGAQISDAMAATHDRRIVHCDLKPDNVIVMYRHGLAGWPMIKVVDFGVARFLDRPGDGTIAGTPLYMAPEQWSGEVEARSDVYGLGVMLYELATGTTPFNGSLAEVATQHAEELPLAPSVRRADIPDQLEDLVLRMLAKEPGMRPRMVDVSRALTDLAFAMPPGARVVEAYDLAC